MKMRTNLFKSLAVTMFMAISVAGFAEDIISFRNGDIVNAIVTDITPSEIKYKKASNPQGPTYTAEKNTILSIKYSNGEIEKFGESGSGNSSIQSRKSQIHIAKADLDNAEQLAKYAIKPALTIKSSDKKIKDFVPIMAFTESSVISTEDILVVIDPTPVSFYDGGWKVKMGYSIKISNKTDSPIYIDRANCFRTYNDLTTKQYFTNTSTSVTQSDGSGVGVGIGGLGVGIGMGSSSNSSFTENYSVDRILTIAPKSTANLIDYKYIRLSENKAKFKTVSDIEYWGFNWAHEPLREGDVLTFTEEDTPYINKYHITYSTEQNFVDSKVVKFNLFAKYVVATKLKKDKWLMLSEMRIVSEIKEQFPRFWTDDLTIVGMPCKIY